MNEATEKMRRALSALTRACADRHWEATPKPIDPQLIADAMDAMKASDAAEWMDATEEVPTGDREVIVFLNGHCSSLDFDARQGGGWGIRLGYWDTDRQFWRVAGRHEEHVTHWRDVPVAPTPAARDESAEPVKTE